MPACSIAREIAPAVGRSITSSKGLGEAFYLAELECGHDTRNRGAGCGLLLVAQEDAVPIDALQAAVQVRIGA